MALLAGAVTIKWGRLTYQSACLVYFYADDDYIFPGRGAHA